MLSLDAILIAAACMKTVIVFYLATCHVACRYRFIFDELKKSSHPLSIKRFINEHNEISSHLNDMNEVFKYGLALVYAVGMPGVCLAIMFLIYAQNVGIVIKTVVFINFIAAWLCIWVVNHECARVCKAVRLTYF